MSVSCMRNIQAVLVINTKFRPMDFELRNNTPFMIVNLIKIKSNDPMKENLNEIMLHTKHLKLKN